MKKTKKSFTKMLYNVVCVLLIAMATVTFASGRFYSGNTSADSAGVAPFVAELAIDKTTSNLLYANANNVINIPQSTHFNVRNYVVNQNNQETDPAVVNMQYSLVYYVPAQTVAQTMAVQLVQDEVADPLTPLYVIKDFIDVYKAGSGSVTTDTNVQKYGVKPLGTNQQEETFVYQGNGLFTTEGCTLSFTTTTLKTNYMIYFSTKSTPDGKDEGLPNIGVALSLDQEIEFYKITISKPQFVLPANTKTQHGYQLWSVPLVGMTNSGAELDNNFLYSWDNVLNANNKAQLEEILSVPTGWTLIVGDNKSISVSREVTDPATGDKITETTNNLIVGINADDRSQHGDSYAKSYPCRLNALFEQTENTSDGA